LLPKIPRRYLAAVAADLRCEPVRLPLAGLFIFIAAPPDFEATPFNIRVNIGAITRIGFAGTGRVFIWTRERIVQSKTPSISAKLTGLKHTCPPILCDYI
jgi:hypothetical protein